MVWTVKRGAVGAEIEKTKTSREEGTGEEVPPILSRLGDLGEGHKLPQRGPGRVGQKRVFVQRSKGIAAFPSVTSYLQVTSEKILLIVVQ